MALSLGSLKGHCPLVFLHGGPVIHPHTLFSLRCISYSFEDQRRRVGERVRVRQVRPRRQRRTRRVRVRVILQGRGCDAQVLHDEQGLERLHNSGGVSGLFCHVQMYTRYLLMGENANVVQGLAR